MDFSYVRRGAYSVMTALAVALTGCGDSPTDDGGGGGGGGPVMTTAVTVTTSFSFDPKDIQVSPGALVTWTWAPNNVQHNVTFTAPGITDSGNQSTGTFQTQMPTAPGTYAYECTFHSGMTGSVLVQ